jgi:hypothetical protein
MNKFDVRRARTKTLIQDANVAELSPTTRMACAFDAVYCHVAQLNGPATHTKESFSPDERIFLNSLEKLGSSAADVQLAKKLLSWHENRWELAPPPCSVGEAISWANRITTECS